MYEGTHINNLLGNLKESSELLLDYVEASFSLVDFDGFKQVQLELIKFAKCWDLTD